MRVVYAHEPLESLFLAGPTPRDEKTYFESGGTDWRQDALEVLRRFRYEGYVYSPVPKPPGVWPGDYYGQIDWELQALKQATVVLFWVPREVKHMPGFTTNIEFGALYRSGKVVLGYPHEAEKMKYLDYVAKAWNIPVFHTLEETISASLKMIAQKNLLP